MRLRYLLLAFGAAPFTGCSSMIATSGADLSTLGTRAEIRSKFGEPIAQGKDDEPYDDFRTRRKLSMPWAGLGIAMVDASTLGLGELWLTPIFCYKAAKGSIVGQELRVFYDDSGVVTKILVDGDGWPLDHPPKLAESMPPVTPVDVKE